MRFDCERIELVRRFKSGLVVVALAALGLAALATLVMGAKAKPW